MSKSTMIELVQELEALPPTPAITEIIDEAKAGEYHDFKNEKYVCGKVALVAKLYTADLHDLAERVKEGEFDETPDEEDRKMLDSLFDELVGPMQ
jgi:capsid portal protein